MRNIPLLLLGLLLVPTVADAQKPKPRPKPKSRSAAPAKPAAPVLPLKTVEEVLDANDRAMNPGGAVKIDTLVATGRMTITPPGLTGTLSLRVRMPDRFLMVQTFPNAGQIRIGNDGHGGWVRELGGTLRDLSPVEQAQLLAEFGQASVTPWRQRYPTVKMLPSQNLLGIWCYVVSVTPKIGPPTTLFIDSKTLLAMRTDTTLESENGTRNAINWIMDYRDVDGVKIAFRARSLQSGIEMISTLEEVTLNAPVDDTTFGKPSPP